MVNPVKEPNVDLHDPDLFMALDDLEVVAQGVVEGALSGLHRSKYVGFSNEFDSHRDYQLGDDLKHVNWNLWSKTDKLFVKQYESDTNLSLYLFIDQSSSMLANNGKGSKWSYAARALAALAYLSLQNRDAAGVYLLEKKLINFIPPAVKTGQLADIAALLHRSEVSEKFNITTAISELTLLCRRKGIVVLFSDFFDQEEELLQCMENFRHAGHEVIVFQILDPWEVSLPDGGEFEFMDLETGGKVKANAGELKKSYDRIFQEWQTKLKKKCTMLGIDWISITTNQPLKEIIIEYLLKRINQY
ncbi:DUF58 domain-containing protein [Puteibacter caeruleilacunae]|nr:DUF58 domain-containing protein [Puteibacter caeruleilacunae]